MWAPNDRTRMYTYYTSPLVCCELDQGLGAAQGSDREEGSEHFSRRENGCGWFRTDT